MKIANIIAQSPTQPQLPIDEIKNLGMGYIPITQEEFDKFSKLIYRESGILLNNSKQGLLKTRLNKQLKKNNCKSYSEFYKLLSNKGSLETMLSVIDQISTNHTYFFREKEHFELLQNTVLPTVSARLKKKGKKDLRLWCAASSTGEEPYSLAMTMMEYFGTHYPDWQAGLLASDISRQVLDAAGKGIFQANQVESIKASLLKKYFNPCGETQFQASEKMRNEITFVRFNLMQEKYVFKKSFDIIFCRNVLIYFDQKTVEKVIERFYQVLSPGGFLFVGHSESLKRINNPFRQQIASSVYYKE